MTASLYWVWREQTWSTSELPLVCSLSLWSHVDGCKCICSHLALECVCCDHISTLHFTCKEIRSSIAKNIAGAFVSSFTDRLCGVSFQILFAAWLSFKVECFLGCYARSCCESIIDPRPFNLLIFLLHGSHFTNDQMFRCLKYACEFPLYGTNYVHYNSPRGKAIPVCSGGTTPTRITLRFQRCQPSGPSFKLSQSAFLFNEGICILDHIVCILSVLMFSITAIHLWSHHSKCTLC